MSKPYELEDGTPWIDVEFWKRQLAPFGGGNGNGGNNGGGGNGGPTWTPTTWWSSPRGSNYNFRFNGNVLDPQRDLSDGDTLVFDFDTMVTEGMLEAAAGAWLEEPEGWTDEQSWQGDWPTPLYQSSWSFTQTGLMFGALVEFRTDDNGNFLTIVQVLNSEATYNANAMFAVPISDSGDEYPIADFEEDPPFRVEITDINTDWDTYQMLDTTAVDNSIYGALIPVIEAHWEEEHDDETDDDYGVAISPPIDDFTIRHTSFRGNLDITINDFQPYMPYNFKYNEGLVGTIVVTVGTKVFVIGEDVHGMLDDETGEITNPGRGVILYYDDSAHSWTVATQRPSFATRYSGHLWDTLMEGTLRSPIPTEVRNAVDYPYTKWYMPGTANQTAVSANTLYLVDKPYALESHERYTGMIDADNYVVDANVTVSDLPRAFTNVRIRAIDLQTNELRWFKDGHDYAGAGQNDEDWGIDPSQYDSVVFSPFTTVTNDGHLLVQALVENNDTFYVRLVMFNQQTGAATVLTPPETAEFEYEKFWGLYRDEYTGGVSYSDDGLFVGYPTMTFTATGLALMKTGWNEVTQWDSNTNTWMRIRYNERLWNATESGHVKDTVVSDEDDDVDYFIHPMLPFCTDKNGFAYIHAWDKKYEELGMIVINGDGSGALYTNIYGGEDGDYRQPVHSVLSFLGESSWDAYNVKNSGMGEILTVRTLSASEGYLWIISPFTDPLPVRQDDELIIAYDEDGEFGIIRIKPIYYGGIGYG